MEESLNKKDKVNISQKHASFAFEKLQEAKECLENRLVSSCIHQCYYACFHIAKAVLYLLGIEAKSHDGVYRMSSLYVFMEAKEGKKLSKMYSQIRDMRNYLDYDVIFYYSTGGKKELIKSARDIYKKAAWFVETMEQIRQELLSKMMGSEEKLGLKSDEKIDGAGKGRKRKNLRKR